MNFSSFQTFLNLVKQKIAEKKGKPFFKGGLGSIVIKFGNTFLQLIIGIVLARTLGLEAFGIYTYVYAIIKIIAIPTELGLPNLLIRFIPNYYSKNKWGYINALLKFTNGAVVSISLSIILISVLLINLDVIQLTGIKLNTFYWGLALLPILALGNLRGAALRGLKHFVLGLVPESIFRHVFFIVSLLIFFYFKGEKMSSVEGMGLQVAAFFLAYLIGAYWLLKKIPQEAKSKEPIFDFKKWASVAVPFLLIGGVQIIMGKIDKVILGIMSSATNVGVYEVAFKGATLVTFSLSAINFVLGPYFSTLFSTKQLGKLQKVATFSVIANTIIAILIAVPLILFGDIILSLIFGSGFAEGYYTLIILSFAQLFSVLSGSVALLLKMTGYEKKVLQGMSVAVIVNITLNIAFIPNYDIEGAAFASLITIVFWNFYMAFVSIQKLKIDPTIISVRKLFRNV